MFKKQSKLFSFILTCTVLLSMLITPLKAVESRVDAPLSQYGTSVQPRWSNVVSNTMTLGPSNGKIYISIIFGGYSGTTYSNGTVVLQKINGSKITLIATWRNLSSSSPVFEFTDNTKSYTAGTYRIAVTITATRNGVSETITLDKESVFS